MSHQLEPLGSITSFGRIRPIIYLDESEAAAKPQRCADYKIGIDNSAE